MSQYCLSLTATSFDACASLEWQLVADAGPDASSLADSLDLPAAVEQLLRRGSDAARADFEDSVLCVGRVLDGHAAAHLVVVLPRSRRVELVPASFKSRAATDLPSAAFARHMSKLKSTLPSVPVGEVASRLRLELHAVPWVRRSTGSADRISRLRDCFRLGLPNHAAAHPPARGLPVESSPVRSPVPHQHAGPLVLSTTVLTARAVAPAGGRAGGRAAVNQRVTTPNLCLFIATLLSDISALWQWQQLVQLQRFPDSQRAAAVQIAPNRLG